MDMNANLFESNRENLLLIPQIVSCFRKQRYHEGTSKLSAFLRNLDDITEFLLSKNDSCSSELQEILLAILNAQDNMDYILQADILDGDLLPLLQKVQIELCNDGNAVIPDNLQHNLSVLRQMDYDLYCILQDDSKTDNSSGKLIPSIAINGQITLQQKVNNRVFYMHSSVDPQNEARMLMEDVQTADYYIVYGMGLGYHVRELLDKKPYSKVIVLENDKETILFSMRYLDWGEYLKQKRLEIIYNDDIKKLIDELNHFTNYELVIHYPSIQAIENPKIKMTLEDFFVTINSMKEQEMYLDNNFIQNSKRKLPDCTSLKPLFENKSVVIVGAGPSASSQLNALKEYRTEITIFATGHAVRTLLNEDIRPDVIIITDPKPDMYKQVKGLDLDDIPLIILSTGENSVVENYSGQTYIAYQKGYDKAEQAADEAGIPVFETGGSVTTTALDIALKFSAKQIIFVGVDLAYTGGISHAKGEGRQIKDFNGLRKVASCNGGEVFTSKNLDIYRKWIQRRIVNEKETTIYNTGECAFIEGTIWTTWDKMNLYF